MLMTGKESLVYKGLEPVFSISCEIMRAKIRVEIEETILPTLAIWEKYGD